MSQQQYPKGILPVLPVSDVDATADFYGQALGFEEVFRQSDSMGISLNAQLRFEDSTLMFNLNPECADLEGGGVYLWVRLFETNIDEYYNSLANANVRIVEDIKDQFWGDRSFTIRDCNNYHIAFNQEIPKAYGSST